MVRSRKEDGPSQNEKEMMAWKTTGGISIQRKAKKTVNRWSKKDLEWSGTKLRGRQFTWTDEDGDLDDWRLLQFNSLHIILP